MTTLKQVTDKLLDAVSASTLAPIALKVAAKYNDDAITDTLKVTPRCRKEDVCNGGKNGEASRYAV